MFEEIIRFIQTQFSAADKIALHEPKFEGRERQYVMDTLDSTFVSSVGAYVSTFEAQLAAALGLPSENAVALVNGTCALQVALGLAGVERGDLVVTQALTFVATCNAIKYLGAEPVLLDVEKTTLGLSPDALEEFFLSKCERQDQYLVHRPSGRKIKACVPMHTLGHPVRIDKIVDLCAKFGVPVVEDAAESLGSSYLDRPTGTFGTLGVLSFNGNKIVTTGGGGAIVTTSSALARRAQHLTTTAKVAHPWGFHHDELGYNYRMPNLNAALGCAQLEQLDLFVARKRELARVYAGFFEGMNGVQFFSEPAGARSNYWLNAILLGSREARDQFLHVSHAHGVFCRPLWDPMHHLPMYRDVLRGDLTVTEDMYARLVNLPSSAVKAEGKS